jgi:hypothetical protein
MLMYFSPKHYDEVEGVLTKYGAQRSAGSGGRVGLANKEEALLAALRRLEEMQKQGTV